MPFVTLDIGPNGQCTTVPPPAIGGWQLGIGQRTHLSHWDCRGMSFLYPFDDWRFLSSTRAQAAKFGTFAFPWSTISQAMDDAPRGATIWVDTGSYAVTSGSIDVEMTLRAPLGDVTLE